MSHFTGGKFERGVTPLVFIPPFHIKNRSTWTQSRIFKYMPSDLQSLLQDWKDKKQLGSLTNPYTMVDPDDYGLFQKRAYQHDLQEAQYAAELQLMMYQNEYNSASSQASRQREAGINPDLAGVSGEAAAGMTGSANPGNINAEHPAETALGLVPTVLSLFTGMSSGFFGVSQGIQQLESAY